MRKQIIIFCLIILLLSAVVYIFTGVFLRHDEKKLQKALVVQPDSVANLWYKSSIIYALDVKVFKDSDGDGVGDFNGLTSRLGFLDSLGVNVIWLAPFQPSPNRDDGYDITNYYAIDHRLGTNKDFINFMLEANAHKFRIIMDLVVNHTSNEHPWFKRARKNPLSSYRSWYVWNKAKPKNYDVGMVFPGVQESIWTYDSLAGEYYYHRFYEFQPDLNMQNPAVQKEVKHIIRYWMALGIKGFRLDAVPFVIEVPETRGDKFEHQFSLLTDLRRTVKDIDPEAIILGEANVLPEENKDFFGRNGDGLDMMLNFYVNQHLFYALATGEVKPLEHALEKTMDMPHNAEWGQFLRNHDEVDLGRLSKSERQKVYEQFGPEKNMQLYDRGIRRRLAPMLHDDRKRLALAYSVLFSLPSTPVIRYGDEIGMGDDLNLQERLSVRTPMQWDNSAQGGFTKAAHSIRPVISDSVYGFRKINVKHERSDSSSLLTQTRQLIALRKHCPEISFGAWEILDTGSAQVLAMQYKWNDDVLVTLHNFSGETQQLSFKIDKTSNVLTNMADGSTLKGDKGKYQVALKGYGFIWAKNKLQ